MKDARARDLAQFVVHLGVSPTEYRSLTVRQRAEIVATANRRK